MKNLILGVKKGSVKNAQMEFQKFTNFKKKCKTMRKMQLLKILISAKKMQNGHTAVNHKTVTLNCKP